MVEPSSVALWVARSPPIACARHLPQAKAHLRCWKRLRHCHYCWRIHRRKRAVYVQQAHLWLQQAAARPRRLQPLVSLLSFLQVSAVLLEVKSFAGLEVHKKLQVLATIVDMSFLPEQMKPPNQ